MLESILDAQNHILVSIDAIKILGLTNAVYCSELISVSAKARRKKKEQDGYFNLDRNYIRRRTSIKPEEQYKCDSALKKVGIIDFNVDNPNYIKFNLDVYAQTITNDDCKFLDKVAKKAKITSNAETKEITKARIIEALQKVVVEDNAEIAEALKHWIEVNVVVDSKVTTDTVTNFQKVLMDYTKSDVKKALRIIEIATAQKWLNPVYAIESYEKEQNLLAKANKVKKSTIKVATKDNVKTEKKY